MTSTRTKIGHGLAKVLGIKLQENEPQEEMLRGESVISTQSFVEEQPTSAEWLAELVPDAEFCRKYVKSLFPFINWIGYYNVGWLIGDLVAGITVGAVVVPQGMAYALLANLDPEFGLYSSFMGVLIYWFFATSKDITIGPVAVLSTVVGNIISRTRDEFPQYAPHEIASALAIISGAIVLFIGLIRMGWIVNVISLTSLSAFMTGSAISIAVGQTPTMMGIKGFSTREATYKVFINTLKGLGRTKMDAAMGLSALTMLYVIRSACSYAAKRWPARQRLFFFLSTLRTAFVILLYTMISWLVNMNRRKHPLFKILGNVPRGFQDVGVPRMDQGLISAFASELPATVIVLVIEHIAISKSFGRVNNYQIDPSQEFVAIGVTNIFAPFLGGFPSTGSFSRTAIKSKAGVKTPFAGVITGLVVLLAIYALTAVFFYIPSASLSAVIIHAVGDLITPPNTVYGFWRVSPLECIIFFIGVFVTIFSSIENGIYATVAISAAMLFWRILRGRGRILGKVKIHSVIGDHVIGEDHRQIVGEYGTFDPQDNAARNVFLPVDHGDGSNPEVELDNPYPGIFIYRFSEGFNYPNAAHSLEYLADYIFARTRRTNLETFDKLADRPWNDPGPSRKATKAAAQRQAVEGRPTLKAVILDFSSVNNVDITSVQQLIDVRNQLDRYASPDVVDWHIACINNRWTKRALAAAGFGYPTESHSGMQHRWRSIFSVAEIGGSDSAAAVAEKQANQREFASQLSRAADEEAALKLAEDDDEPRKASGSADRRTNVHVGAKRRGVVVHGLNRPLFHVDLTSAMQSAIANVEAREEHVQAQIQDKVQDSSTTQ
ncbi:Sulfate permease 2 [Verticillium nonalfalfae]|uniref:Sulfate permease n=2 Tax=Verticillium TaxID=1036719 RepID=C9SM85_VERA1|nr:sulfate permease [Verticillium alfalfae VaMs.102]XP_028499442.1 Sulfate permease 2 [Verticillium nonalfalfae]EEY19900.1 sulfate permease [Verticillium alfalfae VaMs.102]RNJ61284.1 Sulfate permease 2 [Verticillium nonalfalfae]